MAAISPAPAASPGEHPAAAFSEDRSPGPAVGYPAPEASAARPDSEAAIPAASGTRSPASARTHTAEDSLSPPRGHRRGRPPARW